MAVVLFVGLWEINLILLSQLMATDDSCFISLQLFGFSLFCSLYFILSFFSLTILFSFVLNYLSFTKFTFLFLIYIAFDKIQWCVVLLSDIYLMVSLKKKKNPSFYLFSVWICLKTLISLIKIYKQVFIYLCVWDVADMIYSLSGKSVILIVMYIFAVFNPI